MNSGPQVTDPLPPDPGAPGRLRGANAPLLAGLWVAVIVLAVVVDLAK